MRVFISSTSDDLRDYRKAAAEVVRDAQWEPVGMEHFPADPRPIVTMCRQIVGQCDLVLLLQGFRRGWVPTPEQGGDGQTSITSLEIAAADEQLTSVLAFLADENWPGRLWDDEPGARAAVQNFRNELNRNAKFFRWEDDPRLTAFRALLSQELANYKLRNHTPPLANRPSMPVRLRAAPIDVPMPPYPYPLLGPYEHPSTFGGRDVEIHTLETLVQLPPLVLCIHASSGAGKSSLLIAGLAPRLRARGYAVSLERAPGDPGIAQRLIRDMLDAEELESLQENNQNSPREFAELIGQVHSLSGKPAVLVIDQFDDVLRNKEKRDESLARIGPLIAATAQRLPGMQGFACKWLLCYRHEFHGEVRAWLNDVLVQARLRGQAGAASLPHDMSGPQKSHDWAFPVFGKPAATERGDELSKTAFLEAILKPLSATNDAGPIYRFAFSTDGADRLADSFARARKEQPEAPLVPELQVVLNHLLQRTDARSIQTPSQRINVEVPSDERLEAEIGDALRNHLERTLGSALSEGGDVATGRSARTRALLALRELADHEGRRSEGMPTEEFMRMFGQNARRTLDRLASPDARVIVEFEGRCALAHDRLAEVVAEMVRNEAARGNLLVDQSLIDLQRAVTQKVALYQIDGADDSALLLTHVQRALLDRNPDTILFDSTRRSWWEASQAHARRSRNRRLRTVATAALVVAVLSVGSLLFLYPPAPKVTFEEHRVPATTWSLGGTVAVSVTGSTQLVVWNTDDGFKHHVEYEVKCPRVLVSQSAKYVACITDAGDVHVWATTEKSMVASKPLLTGMLWKTAMTIGTRELMGFSSNDEWFHATMPTGDVYAWKTNGSEPARLIAKVDLATRGESGARPPSVKFSPDSKWMTIFDGEQNLYLVNPNRSAQPPEAIGTAAARFWDPDVTFSEDGRWIAWLREADGGQRGEDTIDTNPLFVRDLKSSHSFSLRLPNIADSADNMDAFSRAFMMADDMNLQFSPDGAWIVGRASFEPFVTWNVAGGSGSVGVVSAGKRPESGSDRRSQIWFSRNSEWVAGIANDMRLHLWQLSNPKGLSAEPLFPATYSGDSQPWFDFSPDGSRAAAVAPDGGVYVWGLGSGNVVGEPIARHYAGARVKFSDDSASLYSADPRRVYLGAERTTMELIANTQTDIQAVKVSSDQQRLIIFTTDKVIVATRTMYMWGFPLRPLVWPALSEPIRF